MAPPLGATLFEFCQDIWHQKTKSPWAIVWRCLRDPMFSCFSRTPTCVTQTDGQLDRHTTTANTGTRAGSVAHIDVGVRMNATDVTGPYAAVQYGLIMLACGSRKMEFRHDGKPIGWNDELQTAWSSSVRFSYWKTKPSDGFPKTPRICVPCHV